MSEYSAVLKTVKDNPNKTRTELAAIMAVPNDTNALIQALAMLVADGRVTLTGIPSTGTYASTATQ